MRLMGEGLVHTARVVLGDVNRRLDPGLLRRLRVQPGSPHVLVLGVYRAKNAAVVAQLLTGLPPGYEVALWALDEPANLLIKNTVGVGPGLKFALLDSLLEVRPPKGRTVVFIDDDIAWERGSLQRFVDVAQMADLDIAQPAHSRTSHFNYRVVRARPRTTARITTFVEIGPIFAFSTAAQSELLPFGADSGMGWGLERYWQLTAKTAGLTLGVVDDVRMNHLVPAGGAYDWEQARAEAVAYLGRRGVDRWEADMFELERWPSWRRKPSWVKKCRSWRAG